MKKRLTNSLLAVFEHDRLYDMVRAAAPEGTECLLAGSSEQAMRIIEDSRPDLVLIELGATGLAEALCRDIRNEKPEGSIQILVVADLPGPAEIALLAGFDGAILTSARVEDYRLAIRAAFLRRLRLSALYRDREFYRIAVRREESLSSHLLDEHLALKESFHSLASSHED